MDPTTGVHTNDMGSLWKACEQKLKKIELLFTKSGFTLLPGRVHVEEGTTRGKHSTRLVESNCQAISFTLVMLDKWSFFMIHAVLYFFREFLIYVRKNNTF